MAKPIAPEIVKTIDDFIRPLRTALWLERFRQRLASCLPFFAVITILIGLVHLFLQSLLPLPAAILACSPVLLAIIQAARDRPTMLEAARCVDARIDNNSLLSTGVELIHGRRSADSPFAIYVLRQTADSIPYWQRRIRRDTRRPTTPYFWSHMLIASLGFFFLLQPGAVKGPADSAAELDWEPVTEITPSRHQASLFDEIEKRRVGRQSENPFSSNEADFSNKAGNTQKAAGEIEEKANVMLMAETKNLTQLTGQNIGGQPNGRRLEATARRRQGDNGIGREPDNNPSYPGDDKEMTAPINLTEIPLTPGKTTYGDSAVDAFAASLMTLPKSPVDVDISTFSSGSGSGYANRFSPAQQQYIKDYMNKLQARK